MLAKIKTSLPLNDSIDNSSIMNRLAKRMVLNGLTPEEGALLARDISAVFSAPLPKKTKEKTREVVVSEQVSAVIQDKLPEKLPDPGRFVLDCSISEEHFTHSLCDLGSSINLMPHSVAKRLGNTNFRPTNVSLILADRSTRSPVGVLENVLVQVGKCTIPADFVVLDYDKEPKDPLILGRAFLATTGAIIDVKKGHMSLNIDDKVLHFNTANHHVPPAEPPQVISPTNDTSPKADLPTKPQSLLPTNLHKYKKKRRSTKAFSPSTKDVDPPRLSTATNAYTPPWKLRQSVLPSVQKTPSP